MHYFEQGDRDSATEVVVFMHGFQASGRIWQLVQARLPESYYSVAVNNRGAGETEAPPDESDFGCKPFADDLYELVTQLDLRRFTLVGHSMGGGTVMQFAAGHPELLKALVLLDPVDPDGTAPAGVDVEAMIDERMAARAGQRAMGIAGDGILAPSDGTAEFHRLLAADIAAAPERRLRGSLRSMATLRLGDQAARLTMPVLLAGGDADQLIPLRRMLGTYAKLPAGSGLQIWHGAGHSPNVEIPDEFCAVLRRFIEQTVPAKTATAGAAVPVR